MQKSPIAEPTRLTGAPAAAAVKVQTLARKAGHPWNKSCKQAVVDNLEAAIQAGRHRVMIEFEGLRFRHDLFETGDAQRRDGDNAGTSMGLPGGETSGEPALPRSGATALPPVRDEAAEAAVAAAAVAEQERIRRLEQRAQTATAKRRRQKAARKEREKARRELAKAYAKQQYGAGGALARDVKCPLWGSTTMDLKAAFRKLISELTHRFAVAAQQPGASPTRGVQVHFGGSPWEVAVPSGAAASMMDPTELCVDLLILLDDGLTEEALAKLLKQWSRKVRDPALSGEEMIEDL